MKPNHILRRALRLALVAGAACGALQAHAVVQGISGTEAAGTRHFDLVAADGHISMADGKQVYMWGYGQDSGQRLMQHVGPTLLVNQGETVTVTLTNNLPVCTSIQFVGQVITEPSPAVAQCPDNVIAAQARPSGGQVTYTFVATNPGTYTYQSGTRASLQSEMGMFGAMIVYPTGFPKDGATKRAYAHAGSAFDREYLLVASDLDSNVHSSVYDQVSACLAAGSTQCDSAIQVDLSKRFPDYWMLNGRTSPDVFAKNFQVGAGNSIMPHQPYNALPRMHPGEKLLLRMVGAGTDMHPMHHHGNNSWGIARDGRMLSSTPDDQSAGGAGPDLALSDYTIPTTPGQTYDAIWTWTGKGLGWDIFGAECRRAQPVTADNCRFGKPNLTTGAIPPFGNANGPADRGDGQPYVSTQDPLTDMYKAMPVALPSELELAFGEFYSGSPYLGDFGAKPVGAGAANTSAGYFHMFHSHNEREVVNGGIFPGGMMTMIVVEPFSVAIDVGQP